MNTRVLRNLLIVVIVLIAIGILCNRASAQYLYPFAYPTEFAPFSTPFWALPALGGPWWGTGTSNIALDVASSLPWDITVNYPFGNYIFSTPAFSTLAIAGLGLGVDLTSTAGLSGLPASVGTLPGYGLFAPFNYAGLGVTAFGSPAAQSSLGIPWNWSPYFGLTSSSSGFYYATAGIPWWATPGILY